MMKLFLINFAILNCLNSKKIFSKMIETLEFAFLVYKATVSLKWEPSIVYNKLYQ